MAFGDLIQSTTSPSVDSDTQTCTLGASPTTNNLLVFYSGVGTNGGVVGTIPTGFTLGNLENSGDLSPVWYWKVSDGTETIRTIIWSTGQTTSATAQYLEYEWDGSVPTLVVGEDTTNVTTPVSSQATGSATPSGATNICVYLVAADRGGGMEFEGAWGSATLDIAMPSTTRTNAAVGHLVDQVGSTSDTWSSNDSGEQAYGTVITFSTAGAPAGGNNFYNTFYRNTLAGAS